jgi:glycosyltransferase involved in cell wall biosynthesis
VIFVSNSIYNTLGFEINSEKIRVIPNGIDVNKYINLSKQKKDNLFTFVSNAGTADHKGWHYLLKAIKLLDLKQQQTIKVIIMGTRRSNADISHLIKELPSCIIEWTDFTRTPEKYLIQGDIGFVLSDDCDTISFACREMMACGLPVMVSDFGGLPENIDNGINGWITPVADVIYLKNLIFEIMSLPHEKLQQLSLKAKEKAINEFNLNSMLDKTYKVYDELLNTH